MDGASKFVRGDAIAGILIIFINFIAGMIIGVLQRGMNFDKALHTYTILTIGDGLISQILALIISVAAGLLVIKSGSIGSTDQAIMEQLSKYPKALMITSGFLLAISVVPGMPAIPFIFLGIVIGGISYFVHTLKDESLIEDKNEEEPVSKSLQIDYIRIELSAGLLIFADVITDHIKKLRKTLANEFGFVTPVVRVRDNMSLTHNSYSIKIREFESGFGSVEPNMSMVMNPSGGPIDIEGKDPTFDLDVVWIEKYLKKIAVGKNYTVVGPSMVIITHLTEIINSMPELITYTSTQALLDGIGQEYKKLVSDIVPTKIGVGAIEHVLQRLLAEHVSIKDLSLILKGVAEIYPSNQNIMAITKHVRSTLSRQISFSNVTPEGHIPAISLSTKWEKIFAEGIIEGKLAVEPSKIQEFINVIKSVFDKYSLKGETPILLTSATVRPYIRIVIERFRPSLVILAQSEIHSAAKVKNFGNL